MSKSWLKGKKPESMITTSVFNTSSLISADPAVRAAMVATMQEALHAMRSLPDLAGQEPQL
jgi:cytidylate kinase